MKKTDCHVYPFVKALYWWFLIVYILIVRTRVPYYIWIKWYNIITCILFSFHLHFKFTFTFTFLHQRSPLPFYPFTFKLRPDAAVATSRRNLSYVPTWPSLRRDAVSDASGGGKKHRKSRLQFRETHFQIRQISFCRIRDC